MALAGCTSKPPKEEEEEGRESKECPQHLSKKWFVNVVIHVVTAASSNRLGLFVELLPLRLPQRQRSRWLQFAVCATHNRSESRACLTLILTPTLDTVLFSQPLTGINSYLAAKLKPSTQIFKGTFWRESEGRPKYSRLENDVLTLLLPVFIAPSLEIHFSVHKLMKDRRRRS